MEPGSAEELTQQFVAVNQQYKDLCREIEFSLIRKMDEAGIKWHTITARPKELESFLEKVERKEYTDPFVETEDLAGARIVCLFMVDLDRAGDVISSIFNVLNREDKIAEGDVSAFGYMSHHYVCMLSDRYAGERYDALKGLKFEIQVRTILMDAWANMSHYLRYKNEESIPTDLIKDFHALSALLYVGDRQFEALHKASSRSAANAEDRILRSSEIQESEVNADTMQALLERIFPGRRPPTHEGVSEFISELHATGYSNLAEIGDIIVNNLPSAERRESKAYVVDSQTGKRATDKKYNRVGIARAAFISHDPDFKKLRDARSRAQVISGIHDDLDS